MLMAFRVKEGSWGYRLLVFDGLDGNQVLVNYPNETAASKVASDEAKWPASH
jgi:hypothetical protein